MNFRANRTWNMKLGPCITSRNREHSGTSSSVISDQIVTQETVLSGRKTYKPEYHVWASVTCLHMSNYMVIGLQVDVV